MASPYNVFLIPRPGDLDVAASFRKCCLKKGVFADLKRKAFAMKPGEARRRKQKLARKLARKKMMRAEAATAQADRLRFGPGGA